MNILSNAPANGRRYRQRRYRGAATAMIASLLARQIPSAARPLPPGRCCPTGAGSRKYKFARPIIFHRHSSERFICFSKVKGKKRVALLIDFQDKFIERSVL